MSVTIHLDTRNFEKALQKYQLATGKTSEEVVLKKAKAVGIGLFRQFASITPSIAKLRALPAQLAAAGKGVKRAVGTTVAEEINRRIRARRAAAFGWAGSKKIRKGVVSIQTRAGEIQIRKGPPFSIVLINKQRAGGFAENRYHVIQKAVDAEAADMLAYAKRKTNENARVFNAG